MLTTTSDFHKGFRIDVVKHVAGATNLGKVLRCYIHSNNNGSIINVIGGSRVIVNPADWETGST
jgi:glycosidase